MLLQYVTPLIQHIIPICFCFTLRIRINRLVRKDPESIIRHPHGNLVKHTCDYTLSIFIDQSYCILVALINLRQILILLMQFFLIRFLIA